MSPPKNDNLISLAMNVDGRIRREHSMCEFIAKVELPPWMLGKAKKKKHT